MVTLSELITQLLTVINAMSVLVRFLILVVLDYFEMDFIEQLKTLPPTENDMIYPFCVCINFPV